MSGCKIADGSGIMLVKKDTFSSFLFFSLFLFLLVMLRIGKCKRNRGDLIYGFIPNIYVLYRVFWIIDNSAHTRTAH